MNPATAQAFEGLMQQKQLKDFMSLYQNLVERCFNTCCNDFTSKALSTKEVRPPSSLLYWLMEGRKLASTRVRINSSSIQSG